KFISTTDKQLQEQLKQLHVTLLNLKVNTTYAKELVETLAEKPNRVIFSVKPAKLTPESEILKSSKPVPARKPRPNSKGVTYSTRRKIKIRGIEFGLLFTNLPPPKI